MITRYWRLDPLTGGPSHIIHVHNSSPAFPHAHWQPIDRIGDSTIVLL